MRLKVPVLFALVAVTLLVYWSCGSHDFIILDDQAYVTKNPAVQGGLSLEGIRWAFSAASMEVSGNWHPVTWLSHLADISLFKLDPAGHHLVSVCIHAANVALLFLLLSGMTGTLWPSAVVAAVFALHPLHVESVAWVAERKDVLSAFFWLLTLQLYLGYLKRGGTPRYLATLAAFLVGLMAKPMLVTLPLVMLLLDVWPLRRAPLAAASGSDAPPAATVPWRTLVLEKLPFLGFALVFSLLAIHAQKQGGVVVDLQSYPLSLRLGNALMSYLAYLQKTVWPVDLALFYPARDLKSLVPAFGSLAVLTAISGVVFWNLRRRPYLAVGWAWFLVTLLPVIGLIQVGEQSMADRYLYLPQIGLAIMAVWGIPELFPAGLRRPPLLAGLAALPLVAFAVLTWQQLEYWKNSQTVLEHTIKVTPPNYYAHALLGNSLFQQGRYREALPHYQAALEVNPRHEVSHYKVGIISMLNGDLKPAIKHLTIALYLGPNSERAADARVSLERCLEALRAQGGGLVKSQGN